QARLPQRAQYRDVVGEQAVQTVERGHRHRGIEPTPAFVALQCFLIASIKSQADAIGHAFRKSGNITKTKVETLSGDRVNTPRGISGKSQARADKAPGDVHRQGPGSVGT